jgi:hypothetical protein
MHFNFEGGRQLECESYFPSGSLCRALAVGCEHMCEHLVRYGEGERVRVLKCESHLVACSRSSSQTDLRMRSLGHCSNNCLSYGTSAQDTNGNGAGNCWGDCSLLKEKKLFFFLEENNHPNNCPPHSHSYFGLMSHTRGNCSNNDPITRSNA